MLLAGAFEGHCQNIVDKTLLLFFFTSFIFMTLNIPKVMWMMYNGIAGDLKLLPSPGKKNWTVAEQTNIYNSSKLKFDV